MHILKTLYLSLLALACVAVTTHAQEPTDMSDSLKYNDLTFSMPQLALPGGLIALGAWGVENGFLRRVKEQVRDDLFTLRGDNRFRADDKLQYLPVAANIGLGLVGAPHKHPLREQVAATATAYLSMGIMVNVVKYAVDEKRPDSNRKNSFPSGHTATAFMGAELVRIEYGGGYGIGAYAFATGIAFLRLYNDRHWLNDVVAGAGIGMLSARIGYWLLPVERKWFGWNKSKSDVTIVPAYEPTSRSLSLNVACQLW